MYLKRVTVQKQGKTYAYLKLVHGYREGRRVRERVLLNLGREDELKRSGQLEHLAATFARQDPPMLGVRREVGPLLLVHHYLQRLGLAQIIERALPDRGRAQLTTSEVVSALIANRLCAPSPLYDIAGWASSAALQELFGIPAMLLNDDRLGRALEAFCPRAEEIRGAAALAAIERFGLDAGRLHLDLTALRVCGAYEESSLVAKGWNAERRVERQVKVLQATTSAGIPLYARPLAGNTAELVCVGAALERLSLLLPPGLLFCTDSALGHWKNLCAAAQAGLSFLVPLRDDTGFQERYLEEVGFQALEPLDYVSRRQRQLPLAKRTRYLGALRRFPVLDPQTKLLHDYHVAYIWSSEESRTIADARERALASAEAALWRIQRGLGGPYYKTQKQVEDRVANVVKGAAKGLLSISTGSQNGRPTLSFSRDLDAIAARARLDGVYALATNLERDLSAQGLLQLYKDQCLVELRHRDLKGKLRVRPIFLHNDDRIQALISIQGLALLIFGLMELDLRRSLTDHEQLPGLLPEGRSARPSGRNLLAAFQGLGLTYTAKGIVLDRLTPTQRRILSLLHVPIPWPEQGAE